ncbi:MAG TPA: hypothetical protein PKV75_11035 [Desulfobacterales bacterium]|nr:hypothetical protein [Desulfobacterales bacterium]
MRRQTFIVVSGRLRPGISGADFESSPSPEINVAKACRKAYGGRRRVNSAFCLVEKVIIKFLRLRIMEAVTARHCRLSGDLWPEKSHRDRLLVSMSQTLAFAMLTERSGNAWPVLQCLCPFRSKADPSE